MSIPNFDTYGATSLFTTPGDLLKWAANASKPVVGDANVTRWANEVELLPAYGDTFIGQYQVAFTRGRSSAVDGFTMSSGRVRHVRFVKSAK